MNINILNRVLILLFFIFSQITRTTENKQTKKDKQSEKRNLQEVTYGTATLQFSSTGTKNLVNVQYISKDDLIFYIKKGNNLNELSDEDLKIDDSSSKTSYTDSQGSYYYIKKVSYLLSNEEDQIIIKFKVKPTTLKGFFSYSEANKIILENFQIQNVETMEAMFLNCQSLTELDITWLDTSSVKDMRYMFYNCNKLTQLDTSSWNTANVTNMAYMFNNCQKLTQIGGSNWDTSRVTTMDSMFINCNELTQLEVSKWNTSKVTNMNTMFKGCKALTQLDVSNWDTSKIENMNMFFYNCKSLTQLNVSNWDTSKVRNMNCMFYYCSALTELDLSKWNIAKVTTMYTMFYSCFSLTKIDVSGWDTRKVTNMNSMFSFCGKLTQLNVSGWDTSNLNSMELLFNGCYSLTQLDVSNWDVSRVTNMIGIFSECSSLTKLDVSNWDTSNLKNMENMFYNCKKLTQLNVSNWDTSSTTSIDSIFYGCSSLTELNVSNWSISTLTSLNNVFYNCAKLTQLNISNWDISNIINMKNIFSGCSSLTQLNISDWDVSSVNNMESMFSGCSALTQLNISNWNTSKVINMNSLFSDCLTLTQLNLSNWDTSTVATMSKMFYNCKALKDLNIESFELSQISNSQYANYFLGNDDNLEFCYYSGDVMSSMTQYFLRNCSKIISFKKCGTCDSNSNETHCIKTIKIGTGTGSGLSKTITMIFHYLEEEKLIIDKSERSCYWLEGLENFSYFNKSIIDKYRYIKCDDSCKSCLTEEKMCRECKDGYYSLFNETSQKEKYCYSKLKHYYLYNSTYMECDSECGECDQGRNSISANCLTCNDKTAILSNGNCIKKEIILIKELLNYTYDELKNKLLYDFVSNYSISYYNDNIYILQFMNQNIITTLYNIGKENINNFRIDQLKLDIFKVNFGICYEKIIQQYNISENLVYLQVDFPDNSNKINYLLYDPKTNQTINMDICENMNITLSKNVELNEKSKNIVNNAKEQGYNVINIGDKFYNDICTPYTSMEDTDMTMSDRITDIYDKNFAEFIYYDDCKFEYFKLNESNVTIICKSKVKTNFFEEMKDFKLDVKQLIYNFKFCEASNFYIVKCYKKFFSIKGQLNNYANYIYYNTLAIIIILLIIYCFKGANYLKFKLAKIIIKIKFRDNNKQESMENRSNIGTSKKLIYYSNLNSNDFLNQKIQLTDPKLIFSQIESQNNFQKKSSSILKKKSTNLISNVNESTSKTSQIIILKENISSTKNVRGRNKKGKKGKPLNYILSLNKEEIKQKLQKTLDEERKKNTNIPETIIINQSIKKKNKKKIIYNKNLTEVDFNEFGYHKASKYDERTFMQIYFSYIRLKHSLLSIFYDNYNITPIKIILFVQKFGTQVCTTGLFFKENTMHQIYIDNGSFNFIYRLPFTLYSIIISGIISFLLKRLVSTQRCIINYIKDVEKLNNRNEAINRAVNIIKCYKIRFIFFVISIIVILVVYWFYIGCFCTIYHNTQFYLLKDSLIGFGLSMLYPIGILLIAVLLRLIAIKKKCPFLYKISKLLA